MILDATKFDWQSLNDNIRKNNNDIIIENCCGERFIGCGLKNKEITISGIAGNALGAYLDGGKITTLGNVQDAVGDTMNAGSIIVHGCAGDALGYAMRGGKIFVKENSGYRTGIHMKQYMDNYPVIVVGGKTGSFLGEYLAGGLIIVLGIGCSDIPTGSFVGMGMHGGEIWLRSNTEPQNLPEQVCVKKATSDEINNIYLYIKEFCTNFNITENEILNEDFYRLTPNEKSPYKQLYTLN